MIGLLVMAAILDAALGHGRLLEPPSRATMWRFGFRNPPDYNDHESFCGGLATLIRNAGRCGLCGDPFDAPTPRPHETGGRFGQGTIVRTYQEAQEIAVKVELTAHHRGYFELKLCNNNNNGNNGAPREEDEACFQHLLTTPQRETRYYVGDARRSAYDLRYSLPRGVTCDRCVLQWTYVAGNNWGRCPNGTEAVGCGPQETFRACADVAVRPRPTSMGPPPLSSVPKALLFAPSIVVLLLLYVAPTWW